VLLGSPRGQAPLVAGRALPGWMIVPHVKAAGASRMMGCNTPHSEWNTYIFLASRRPDFHPVDS
jgi:hypothetical protein